MPKDPMLTREECTAILDETDHFAARSIAPLFAIADRPPTHSAMENIFETAMNVGILPSAAQAGFALWELADDQAGFQMHIDTLLSLARRNAGTAFEMHLRSLARTVLISTDANSDAVATIALDAQPGLGRYSLAKYLSGAALEADDEMILAQIFVSSNDVRKPFYVQAFDFAQIILPVWQKENGLQWQVYAREDLELEAITARGLDELIHYSAQLKANSQPLCTIAANLENNANFLRVMHLHQAALMAIQVALAEHAWHKAKDYAFSRFQGGTLIKNHPAVQQLLLNCYSVWRSGKGLLQTFESPSTLKEFADILAKRSTFEPLLHSAVTDALQVFGGYGYMQDYGIEKLLRDQNHLSRLGGNSGELRQFLAAIALADTAPVENER